MTNEANKTTTTLSFGGGVDSSMISAMDLNRPLAAELLSITLEELNAALPTFNEVVFADTGAETSSTYANVERFTAAFEAAGKTVHIVRRHEVVNQRVDDTSITDWLLRLGTIPVMAGGSHVCSNKFKGETIAKAIGERHFIIGIEANEGRRLVFTPPKGGSTFCYPLVDLGITREMCLEMLPKLGFEGVEKSSCVFCPFKSEEELRVMWKSHKEDWDLCLQVEENFRAASPVRHQAWLDAGQPSPTPNGMWKMDSWSEGRRLFVKKINGQQLSVQEWADKFEAEENAAPVQLIPVVEIQEEEVEEEVGPTSKALPIVQGGRRIVHGTPVTPAALLPTLAGNSFCVSFAHPRQLDECIDLVNAAIDADGHDQMLLLDNGAFSIWMAGIKGKELPGRLQFETQADYRQAFWTWANEAQSRCPQAIAVIPDVIQGSERENLQELSWALREGMADYPERTMSIWHMDESQDFLATQCRLMNFIGIGSCAEFDVQKNRAGYLEVMKSVGTTVSAIDAVTGNRPWVHLMRGLGVFKDVTWADSADSTNVAVNSNRLKDEFGDLRFRELARRVEDPIQTAAIAA